MLNLGSSFMGTCTIKDATYLFNIMRYFRLSDNSARNSTSIFNAGTVVFIWVDKMWQINNKCIKLANLYAKKLYIFFYLSDSAPRERKKDSAHHSKSQSVMVLVRVKRLPAPGNRHHHFENFSQFQKVDMRHSIRCKHIRYFGDLILNDVSWVQAV